MYGRIKEREIMKGRKREIFDWGRYGVTISLT